MLLIDNTRQRSRPRGRTRSISSLSLSSRIIESMLANACLPAEQDQVCSCSRKWTRIHRLLPLCSRGYAGSRAGLIKKGQTRNNNHASPPVFPQSNHLYRCRYPIYPTASQGQIQVRPIVVASKSSHAFPGFLCRSVKFQHTIPPQRDKGGRRLSKRQ